VGPGHAPHLRGRHAPAAVLRAAVHAGGGFAPKLYLWAQAGGVQADEILKFKAPYLNLRFFDRARGLLRVWLGLLDAAEPVVGAAGSRRGRRRPSATRGASASSARRARHLRLLMSLAAVDWIMSLDPHWYSTIFGSSWSSARALGAVVRGGGAGALRAARADEPRAAGGALSTISAS
jgi:hypothetical protein